MAEKRSFLIKILPPVVERAIRGFRDKYLRSYHFEELPKEIYSSDLKYYSISFCTTCMNRLFHLKHTLETNIKKNQNYPNIEFVLIDYNSKDGLESWAKKKLGKYIKSGVLNYYKTNVPEKFHASIAKNLAHKVAKGQILCNLDGDNFTGEDFAFYINYLINKHGENSLLHFRKEPFWGTEGRIVLSADNFKKIGGYDESLLPIGHEDHDLLNRAKAFGLDYKNIQVENFLKYLSNTTREKAENCVGNDESYYQLEQTNKVTSDNNIKLGRLEANTGGTKEVVLYKNFTLESIIVK